MATELPERIGPLGYNPIRNFLGVSNWAYFVLDLQRIRWAAQAFLVTPCVPLQESSSSRNGASQVSTRYFAGTDERPCILGCGPPPKPVPPQQPPPSPCAVTLPTPQKPAPPVMVQITSRCLNGILCAVLGPPPTGAVNVLYGMFMKFGAGAKHQHWNLIGLDPKYITGLL